MSERLTSSNTHTDPHVPVNDARPIRIAVLGGTCLGKLLLASKLSINAIHDTHYPTQQATPILFQFGELNSANRAVLDPNMTVVKVLPQCRIVLSPVIDRHLELVRSKDLIAERTAKMDSIEPKSRTEYYQVFGDNLGTTVVTPILVELIDTPAFKPDQVVPFLEELLYVKLDPKILHNLANEPRRDVTTSPFLVASGAGELNGRIDGYLFVYSAVPTHQPPAYGKEQTKTPEDSFILLKSIKDTLEGAWREYSKYRRDWIKGQEEDPFTIKSIFKNLWGSEKDNSRRKVKPQIDPLDPYGPPPFWIVCTSVKLPLALNQLIAEGMQLAEKWGCGFIGVDVKEDVNVELALSFMLREVAERAKLQKKWK